jgi:hypothetical protein
MLGAAAVSDLAAHRSKATPKESDEQELASKGARSRVRFSTVRDFLARSGLCGGE